MSRDSSDAPWVLSRRAACAAMWPLSSSVFAQVPSHYPSDYASIVDGARKEGRVVVYAATDLSSVAGLVRDFESLRPGVKVDYRELNGAELYIR